MPIIISDNYSNNRSPQCMEGDVVMWIGAYNEHNGYYDLKRRCGNLGIEFQHLPSKGIESITRFIRTKVETF